METARAIAEGLLQSMQFRVDSVDSGEAALAAAEAKGMILTVLFYWIGNSLMDGIETGQLLLSRFGKRSFAFSHFIWPRIVAAPSGARRIYWFFIKTLSCLVAATPYNSYLVRQIQSLHTPAFTPSVFARLPFIGGKTMHLTNKWFWTCSAMWV